jgi:glycosyltransferase involved in cell wall biosynthesis
MILFSVVIPLYNRSSCLDRLLNSLLSQTYKNFEVIIVDDGSTDSPFNVIKKFTKLLNLVYKYIPNSGGPAGPRNLGVKLAKYDWICLLDSDDYWLPNKLKCVHDAIVTGDKFDVYFHPMILQFNETITKKVLGAFSPVNNGLDDFFSLIYNGNRIITSSLVLRKKVFDTIDGFEEAPDFKAIEDLDLLLKMSIKGFKFHNLQNTLGIYTCSDDNISADEKLQIKKLSNLNRIYLERHPLLLNRKKLDTLILYKTANYYKSICQNFTAKSLYLQVIFRANNKIICLKSFFKLFFQ